MQQKSVITLWLVSMMSLIKWVAKCTHLANSLDQVVGLQAMGAHHVLPLLEAPSADVDLSCTGAWCTTVSGSQDQLMGLSAVATSTCYCTSNKA